MCASLGALMLGPCALPHPQMRMRLALYDTQSQTTRFGHFLEALATSGLVSFNKHFGHQKVSLLLKLSLCNCSGFAQLGKPLKLAQ